MRWYEIISTWFGLGKSSFMPGTIGSLGAYPLFYFSVMSSETASEARSMMLFFVIVLCLIGFFAIRKYHKQTGIIDDQSIVVDEVIGQLVTFVIAYEWIGSAVTKFFLISSDMSNSMIVTYMFICGFIPFRFFDITKPLYISLIDRYWKNAVGVILDDVIAGVYAGAVFYVLR
jgi:phosphatidylglycerophosphatase A